jgi:16S rRNA (cytosine967-C5)-methyltransferase
MPSEARSCAYRVLRRVFEQDAYADLALRAEARELDRRDHALAMRLTYGAVQRSGTLEHVATGLAGRPAARFDPAVLAGLRLGLYELLYLRGSPDHAVVDDVVELVKRSGSHGHGLVNAVLRRAAREGPTLLEALSEDTPEEAAVKHSHPAWIARLWWRELGPERARALMACDNEPGELALRVNTLVGEPEAVREQLPVPARLDPLIPEALIPEEALDLHASPLWRAGALTGQSRAAMLAARALAPRPGERVLDLCAGPGGKSTHLAALMEARGEVLAVERDRARAGRIAEAARRLAASNIRVEVTDATRERPEGAAFDRVLVDPPCSGLGTLQARPDLRWRVPEQALDGLVRLQADILEIGARALRPGGLLVYSTCTISSAENERQIAAFLSSHHEFALEDLGAALPDLRHPTMPACLLTLPDRDRTAGFFIARIRRGEARSPTSAPGDGVAIQPPRMTPRGGASRVV